MQDQEALKMVQEEQKLVLETVISFLVLDDDNDDEKNPCFIVVKSKGFKINRTNFQYNFAFYCLNDPGQVT